MFTSVYRALEGALFNTLWKKILCHQLLMLLPSLAGLGFLYSELPEMQASISWIAASLLVVFALGTGFLNYQWRRPICQMTAVLNKSVQRDGDISIALDSQTQDELAKLAGAYNRFSEKLREMIMASRSRSVGVALAATRLQQALQQAGNSVGDQQQYADEVFAASEQVTSAMHNVTEHTQQIQAQTSSNLDSVHNASDELTRVLAQIGEVQQQMDSFAGTVAQLSDNSERITQILQMVKGFSDQTNLLALNASIEAARAGDAGRGFSVVADEVRSLAHKVSHATEEIDQNLIQMVNLVDSTRQSADKIQQRVGNSRDVIEQTCGEFHTMVEDFERITGQLLDIGGAMQQLESNHQHAHQQVHSITSIAGNIQTEMATSKDHSRELELATEQTQELLSRFVIGQGGFEQILQTGRRWAGQLSQALEQLKAAGEDVFDQRYQRLNPDELPEKYQVSYTRAYQVTMQPLFDQFLQENPAIIYAIGVDNKGYAAAHHAKVSKPITGDFAVDNLKSRHMRIFAGNRAEQRRASSTAPFLLQTFIRDTGEVLNDLSFPIYVDGRHWGALIMGFNAQLLLED